MGETQYKAGHIPYNHKPVGTEVINGDGYWQVKISEPNKWKLKHRIEWEEHYGPIPKGDMVIFADQDRNNFDIDNLALITKAQNVRMNQNGLYQNDAEATKTGIIIADLIIKTAAVKKKVKGGFKDARKRKMEDR